MSGGTPIFDIWASDWLWTQAKIPCSGSQWVLRMFFYGRGLSAVLSSLVPVYDGRLSALLRDNRRPLLLFISDDDIYQSHLSEPFISIYLSESIISIYLSESFISIIFYQTHEKLPFTSRCFISSHSISISTWWGSPVIIIRLLIGYNSCTSQWRPHALFGQTHDRHLTHLQKVIWFVFWKYISGFRRIQYQCVEWETLW